MQGQDQTHIQKMFNKIAGSYDLANSVLSFGTHHLWKNLLVKKVNIKPGQQILDCATGTGDIAFTLEKKSENRAEVIGIDFSEQMLEVARKRARLQSSGVHFQFADIEDLPFHNASFDAVTISFGLRNVKDVKKGLQEMARVTKPGGLVVVLEFGQPQTPGFKQVYNFYSDHILPTVGGIISGEKSAYRYLNETSAKFPCGEGLCEIARSLGVFKSTEYRPLSLGIAYLYWFKV